MKITQSQLRQMIKEELESVLTEQEAGITPEVAKSAVGAILARMPQGARPQERQTMGFMFTGNASVDKYGNIGFQLSDEATFISPAGGSSGGQQGQEQPKQPVPTREILRNLREHRGLAAQLKKKGLSLSNYDPSAPGAMLFKFGPAGFHKGVFEGYIINPA
jgi:hypothetical protein